MNSRRRSFSLISPDAFLDSRLKIGLVRPTFGESPNGSPLTSLPAVCAFRGLSNEKIFGHLAVTLQINALR